MDSRKIVLRETVIIAIGELALSAIMVGIFAALNKFNLAVLLSALGGSLVITANHFFMAITVNLAADRAEQGNVQQAQKMVQLSSIVRLLVMGGLLVLGIQMGANVLALVLPLAFSRPILMLAEFFRKKGD
ncbi:MAG: ATP synthase subunit I [Oscillospiraceae bacterium]|nr:ATP synthase subunit I [Oscillospiraceae bacterium]